MNFKVISEIDDEGNKWYRVHKGTWQDAIAYSNKRHAEERRKYFIKTPPLGTRE